MFSTGLLNSDTKSTVAIFLSLGGSKIKLEREFNLTLVLQQCLVLKQRSRPLSSSVDSRKQITLRSH